ETLEKVKTMEAKIFVPSHADPTEDITELAQYNIDKVNEVADKIVEICAEPISFEAVLQKLFTDYDLVMNFEQHALVGSTVRSYLAWLKDTGRLDVEFTDNMLLWKQV
ncbi:MAG: MBL fold metallo-hydrolase, partial [Firmicutes bacterium]|nr:MBL fold metallo-hydrolase [Bacillota bacterium]